MEKRKEKRKQLKTSKVTSFRTRAVGDRAGVLRISAVGCDDVTFKLHLRSCKTNKQTNKRSSVSVRSVMVCERHRNAVCQVAYIKM